MSQNEEISTFQRPNFRKAFRLGRRFVRTVSRTLLSRGRVRPTLILMYHRICDQAEDPHFLCVHPQRFRQQISQLRDSFSVVPLHDWNRPEDSKKPRVVVTFDDGYADNLHQALPILEEFGIPFTLFVCTGPVEKQVEFPTDRLDRVIDAALKGRLPADRIPSWMSGDNFGAANQRFGLHRWFYRLSPPDREDRLLPLEQLLGFAGQARESHRAMTIAELQTLAKHPLAMIGSHTENHPCLASLNFVGQQQEIVRAHAKLVGWLGGPVESFAYPYGQNTDYDSNSIKICCQQQIQHAATTEFGQAWNGTDSRRLPRFPVRNWDLARFTRMLRIFRWL